MAVLTSASVTGPGAPPVLVPADLDRRFYAYVLDRALGWGLATGVGALVWYVVGRHDWRLVGGAGLAALVVVSVVLAVLQGTSGATPGKSALGIRAVSVETGAPAGIGRCLRRGLLLGLAGLPTAGLGVATLAWTAASDGSGARRAWHDRRSGTEVVDVRRGPVGEATAPSPAPAGMVNLTALRLAQSSPAPAAPAGRVDPAPEPSRPAVAAPETTAQPGAQPPSQAGGPSPTQPPAQPPAQPALQAAAQPAAQAAAQPPPAQPAVDAPRRTEPEAPRDGQRLGGPLRAGAVEPPARPAPTARWRVTFDSGESLVLDGVLLVGRGPQPRAGEDVRHLVPLRSSDMSLSKTHAQVHVARDGVLVVTDRGSTNGSMIVRRGMSRELTAGRPATLVDGDRVRFGDREMRVARES